jgi:hypothetical protein
MTLYSTIKDLRWMNEELEGIQTIRFATQDSDSCFQSSPFHRERRGCRNAGRAGEPAEPVLQVGLQAVERRESSRFPTLFFPAQRIPEFLPGAAAGLCSRDSAGDEVLGSGVEMKLKFRVHVPLQPGPEKDCAQK